MKLKKVLAVALAAGLCFTAAPTTEAMAAEVTKTEEVNVVLDSANESTKMYQLHMDKYAGSGELEKIVVTITFAQTETLGWTGGSGAIGYSTDGDWQQVDFEHQFIDGATNTVDIVVEIADGVHATYDAESIVQVGWWWGSTSSITVDKIDLVFDSVDAETPVEDTTETPAEDTTEAPAEDTTETPAEDEASAVLPKTGLVSGFAFAAVGSMLVAAGAAIRGKKED